MLRFLIILTGVLVGYSTYQAQPDMMGAIAAAREAPLMVRLETFVASWQFVCGVGAGVAAGEVFRWLWSFTMTATEFVSTIGGRIVQYAAIASVIGIVVYFI